MHWLRPELARGLERARTLVEQYVEEQSSAVALREAVSTLQEISSSARIVQCAGVTIAAAELAEALDVLAREAVEDVPGLATAVVGALMQLDDYADAVVGGLPDHALALHPALNDLRVARGEPPLGESELFAHQLVLAGTGLEGDSADDEAPAARTIARKYESTYRQALAHWLRSEAREGIARVGKLAEAFARGSEDGSVRLLWRSVAAAAECALGGRLAVSLELKRLLGRTLPAVGALAAGEAFADAELLAGALLWHLGRVESPGPRTRRLRDQLQLERYLPDADTLAGMRARLRGTNSALIAQLSQELRNDLGRVKDHIDLRVRAGAGDMEEARQLLEQMAHTLSMLGLPALSRVARNQMSLLSTLLEEDADATHEGWIDIASALLRIDISLDEALYRQLSAGAGGEDSQPLGEEIPNAADLKDGEQALVRESQVNVSRVKTAIDGWLRTGSNDGLFEGPAQLQQVSSVLNMIAHNRFGELVAALAGLTAEHGLQRICEEPSRAERFADAIAVVDFYLESLLQRNTPGRHLVETLSGLLEGLAPADDEVAPDDVTPAEGAAVAPAEDAPAGDDEVDPEIRNVFLEEATEVQETIEAAYARWQRDPEDTEAMLEVRRGFHTLKGSGRMVGASALGEFAWACERLLNACRDGGLAVTPAIVSFTGEAVAFVPEMVRAFADANSIADPERLEQLSATADRLRQGGATDAEREELLATFYEDAASQLALSERLLQQYAGRKLDDPDLLRAFHTLRGSSAAVGFEHFSVITGDAESYLNALKRASRRLDREAAEALRGIVAALREKVVERAAELDAEQLAQWREVMRGLHNELPESEREDADSHAISDAFAIEALDWLNAVAEQLSAWQADPSGAHYAPAMRDQLRTLSGTAANSGCEALAQPSARFVERMEAAVAETRPPQPAALELAQEYLEALYQQLDAFREGGDPPEAPEALAARIAVLDWQATEAAVQPEPPASAQAAIPDQAPQAPLSEPAVYDNEADAAELRELFVGEAVELLEAIDSDIDRLERGAQREEALRELARSLHTFKGSARMAGYDDLGEVAHRCETLASRIEEGRADADTVTLSRLHNAADGLYRAVEQLRAGSEPDVSALLADTEELDAAPAAVTPESAPDAEAVPTEPHTGDPEGDLEMLGSELAQHPALDGQDVPTTDEFDEEVDTGPAADVPRWQPSPGAEEALPWGDAPEPEPEPPSVHETVPEPAAEPMPAARDDGGGGTTTGDAEADAALYAGFREEAAELLETIQSTLERWQRDSEQGVPVGEAGSVIDLRRALHTMKGSARMVDASSMAAVAHEMESLVEDLLAGQMEPDSATFMQLQTRLEQLQYLHDHGRSPSAEAAPPSSEDDASYFDSSYIDELQASAPQPEPEVVPAPEAAAVSSSPVRDAEARALRSETGEAQWDPRVFWKPPAEDEGGLGLKREFARVPVPDLESLLNQAGEISVLRARLDEQNAGIGGQLDELAETVNRLRDQLRQLDTETEAQIEARGLAPGGEQAPDRYAGDFDPLEMDRYSRMQELSRALAETVGDINVLQEAMRGGSGESEALLQQQQRVNSDLQQGLMGTLMVPFARQTQRLQRVVRQTAQESGKQVNSRFSGETIEVDRNVLERMTAPLEHALRNAVIHGIEDAETRRSRGKAESGSIDVSLEREGQQLRLTIADDGGGLDFEAIRRGAIERGLMHEQAELSQAQLALFILEPGFSTARELTQSAGRGVGMDVLAAEVRQLGGSLEIDSRPGQGTQFVIHLPITLGLAQALMFSVGEERFAVPLTAIEGIARVPRADAMPADGGEGRMQYGDREYRIAFAADYLGLNRGTPGGDARALPAILLRLPEGVDEGPRELALIVDQVIGNREVVAKTIGPVLAAVPGMSGATILPDGRIVLLLDLPALIQDRIRRQRIREAPERVAASRPQKPSVMVVDDSITMRRVAERLLERNGYEVWLARDGVDAMGQLATLQPDVVLLDIEMPRADGFEVASYMRNTTHLERTPIIMITSRSGDKHRERAAELGVQRYLIKPYQENELLGEINSVRAEASA